MRRLDLPTQFIHEGKLFGPGVVELDDSEPDGKRVADDLTAASRRFKDAAAKGPPGAPVSTVLSAPLQPGQPIPGPMTATGQTPAEIAEGQKAQADKAAADAQAKADAEKAAKEGEEGEQSPPQNQSQSQGLNPGDGKPQGKRK